jgi:hypothetical protein
MALLFGRGDPGQVLNHLNSLAKSDQLFASLLCITGQHLDFSRSDLVWRWYEAGEYRAAIEEFLFCVADQQLATWLPSWSSPLIYCGLALRNLGDQISAYAAFRLATFFEVKPKEILQEEREDAEARKPSVAQIAAEHAAELEWARGLLDCDRGLLSFSTRGPGLSNG